MKKVIVALMVLCIAFSAFAQASQEQAPAAKSMSLTVYCPHEAEPLNAGVKEFQEATGITVDVVAAGSGELLKRIEAEADNPLCDVFWGGGAESAAAYAQYFDTFVSKYDDQIADTLKDPNDKWIGESPVPVVIMYNKDLVGNDIPTGWADLLNPKYKGQIAYADPAKSGSAYTLLCTMIQAFGKDDGKGWEFIKQLYANLDGKIQGSSSNSYKLVADGEYAIGLTQEKSVKNYLDAGATNIGMVYPKEGTSAVPDSIAIVKNCKNPENAKIFVDFMLGQQNQEMMSNEFARRSIRFDINPPSGLVPLAEIKLVDYDFAWASTQKAEILAKWKNIVIGKE